MKRTNKKDIGARDSTKAKKGRRTLYIESSYLVMSKDDIKIYDPSVITTRKRVISA